MKRLIVGMAVVAMMLGVVASKSVFAAEGEDHCKADKTKFCPYAVKDKGHVVECLDTHKADLSPECKKWVGRHHEVVKAREAACAEDKKKFCKDVRAGYEHFNKCLEGHMADLSGDCKATFKM